MARTISKILISTMPRSGTVFLFDFIAELFGFRKLEPAFTGGLKPVPPEWDPYKHDRTYRVLKEGEVLCAHYLLDDELRSLIRQPDVLAIYLYRDPRDVTVSAAMYIKYALTHHVLHPLFAEMSEEEAITFILAGGVVVTGGADNCGYISHQGVRYFCDIADDWLNDDNVAAIRYEELMTDPVDTVAAALQRAGVEIDRISIQAVAERLTFDSFSGGRARGVESKSSHFRKGVAGEYKSRFTSLHKSICKGRIGEHLIRLRYETDLLW